MLRYTYTQSDINFMAIIFIPQTLTFLGAIFSLISGLLGHSVEDTVVLVCLSEYIFILFDPVPFTHPSV